MKRRRPPAGNEHSTPDTVAGTILLMRIDEPQEGIVPFLRERFEAIPYRPGLSDAETALSLLKSGVRNTWEMLEVLQRVEERLGERVALSVLRANAGAISSAMAATFADESRALFGTRAADEMRTLVGGVIDKLSAGFSSVTDGLDRVVGEITGTRNELVTTREVLAGILDATHEEIVALRLEALETREELTGRLDTLIKRSDDGMKRLHVDLHDIHETLKRKKRSEAEEFMLAGVDYMNQREPDFGDAIGELLKSLDVFKRNPRARYLLGICYVKTNQAQRAKAAFHEAIKIQDDKRIAADYCQTAARFHIALARSQTDQNATAQEYRNAADMLSKGTELSPDDHEIRFQRAIARAIVGDLDGAASDVQRAMLASPVYEDRAGLVPELTSIYRDRVKLLHEPISKGSATPSYVACLRYGRAAIDLGEDALAGAYLVGHLSRCDVEEHVQHFDRLLRLPSHPATTELLRKVLAHPQIAQHMKLSTLLRSARELLQTHAVNPASAISAYSLNDLLGVSVDRDRLLALPDVIRSEVISRIATGEDFGQVYLAEALDAVFRVRRLGSSYAETAARMLSWHAPSLAGSAITTWVVLDRLARTGCMEQLRTSVDLLLHTTRWLDDQAYWEEKSRVVSTTGLSELEVRNALKPEATESRVAAVAEKDPSLAAAIAARLIEKIGHAKVFFAIPPSSRAWADPAFRCVLFQSAHIDAGTLDHFLRLFTLFPTETVPGAAADFAAVARIDGMATLSVSTITLVTEIFRKPLPRGTLDPLFRWFEPFLVRQVANVADRENP